MSLNGEGVEGEEDRDYPRFQRISFERSSPLVPNRALLTRRNYTPVKIGIKLTGKTSGVRVWILFSPKPARLKVICKKLAKICIFPPKKSIKISFIIKSGLQIVFLSSMGHQEHIL